MLEWEFSAEFRIRSLNEYKIVVYCWKGGVVSSYSHIVEFQRFTVQKCKLKERLEAVNLENDS